MTEDEQTAAELLRDLTNDPEFAQRVKSREQQRQLAVQANRRAAAPLLAELADAGFKVESVGELFNRKLNYEKVIPVLMRWLPRISNSDVKQDIARALSVEWAKGSAALLIDEFRKAEDGNPLGVRWAIGNALAVVADDPVFDDLAELVQDPQYGRAREMLAVALGNMRNERATAVLMDLLEDEELAGHAIMALGKLKAAVARPKIERFLDHPRAWVGKEARKALASIDRNKRNGS